MSYKQESILKKTRRYRIGHIVLKKRYRIGHIMLHRIVERAVGGS